MQAPSLTVDTTLVEDFVNRFKDDVSESTLDRIVHLCESDGAWVTEVLSDGRVLMAPSSKLEEEMEKLLESANG